MKLLTIIPAKLDSKRLPNKNLQEINNKSLIEHSIGYAKQSKYDNVIVVSTEDTELVKKSLKHYSNIILQNRPKELCGDVEVVEVYFHVVKKLIADYFPLKGNLETLFDYVICLQPDNPNRSNTLDECLNYMIKNNYDDLITINPSYKRSGSVRVFKYNHLINGHVSKRIGCIKDDATDIHYQEDLERAKTRI